VKLAVVGLGKLGAPLAVVLAEAGHSVIGIDRTKATVSAVQKHQAPVTETGLAAAMKSLGNNLLATDDYEGVSDVEMSFVIVPTPSDISGRFSTDHVLEAVKHIGANIKTPWHTVVVVSTVMPGSMSVIRAALEKASGRKLGDGLSLCYSPEFIALGSVLHDLRNPDMVLIGAEDDRSAEELETVLRSFVQNEPNYHRMSFVEAELAKIAVNAYVTMKISFANTLAEMAEHWRKADARVIAVAIGEDQRIGTTYLQPGAAFGGPCFPRDCLAFQVAAVDAGTSAP
jgi:UDPglucose 6-dehydrogenase